MTISQATLEILRRVRTLDVTLTHWILWGNDYLEMHPPHAPAFPGDPLRRHRHDGLRSRDQPAIPRLSYDEFDDRQYKRNSGRHYPPGCALARGSQDGRHRMRSRIDRDNAAAGCWAPTMCSTPRSRVRSALSSMALAGTRTSASSKESPVFCTIRSCAIWRAGSNSPL